MRVYLDVCCLNRPFDDQTQDRIHLETEAIFSIMNHRRIAGWVLIGSEAIDFEISKNPDENKRVMARILSSLHDVHIKVDDKIEKRAIVLTGLGLKTLDAMHVACAEKARADILLTTDDNLLNLGARHIKKMNIKIENPLRWAMEVLK